MVCIRAFEPYPGDVWMTALDIGDFRSDRHVCEPARHLAPNRLRRLTISKFRQTPDIMEQTAGAPGSSLDA